MPVDERLAQVAIEDEMRSSYLDYAMSVIVGRALPDVRDGLKPVHRRILYGMHEMGLVHNRAYRKSARSLARSWGTTTHTATRRSTTPSCGWRRTSTCAIPWRMARPTSERWTPTPRPRRGTP